MADSAGPTTLRIALLGFGNVGKAVARLLLERADRLADAGLTPVITGIATRHAVWIDPAGVDLARALAELGGTSASARGRHRGTDSRAFVADVPADVLVETTVLVRESGEPATELLRLALQRGLDVVTTNKGPIAWHGHELRPLARSLGRELRFESTVMDGCPIFSLVERTLPGVRVMGLRGVLNSTGNFVASRIARGASYESALAEAVDLGVAEADPSNDLDGWDATMKLCCLANILMGARLRPDEVEREDWREPRSDPAGTWRQIATVSRQTDGTLTARVRWECLPPSDVLAPVDGLSTAVSLETDLLGTVTVGIEDPGTPQTAYGVLADLIEVARRRGATNASEGRDAD
jgi:homoserine dehydrogenase